MLSLYNYKVRVHQQHTLLTHSSLLNNSVQVLGNEARHRCQEKVFSCNITSHRLTRYTARSDSRSDHDVYSTVTFHAFTKGSIYIYIYQQIISCKNDAGYKSINIQTPGFKNAKNSTLISCKMMLNI